MLYKYARVCTFSQVTLFFTLFCSNKLRREIRNKDVSKVSNSSSSINLLINLEKSRIRNQTLLKVCYMYFIWKEKIICM